VTRAQITRRTLVRVMAAMLMLPNWTAYWYLMPRRWKMCAGPMELLVTRQVRAMFDRLTGIHEAMRGVPTLAPISKYAFRLPFQVTR